MKKLLYSFVPVLLLLTVSCASSSSPEELAQQDAADMNTAIRNKDADGIEKATILREKHIEKLKNNTEDYFKYMEVYTQYLQ